MRHNAARLGTGEMQVLKEMTTLGWREWISLPDLGITQIKAKVDTGARTSALHAFRVEPFERDAQPWVRFSIHPEQRDAELVAECEAQVLDQRVVRDSGGHEELRYVIQTRIKIGEQTPLCEVTLTNRDDMRFRVLLGRTTLRQNFLVDSGSSYLCGRPKRKKRAAVPEHAGEQ